MKQATLFVDESGKSSLIEKTEEPFVLTGVILNNEDINTVEGFFNYIKKKHSFDANRPFHSYHIFENPKTYLSTGKASDLVITLAEFLSLIPIKINILSINKKEFRDALGIKSDDDFKGSSEKKEMRQFPYRIMASSIFHWFAKYLKLHSAIGQIIADSRRGGDYQVLRTLELSKDPYGPLSGESSLIKEKCTAICFASKNYLSGGLEIADLISYTSFFHAKRAMKDMDHIKLVKIWSEIREKLENKKVKKIAKNQIRNFFKIEKGGVYKCLKDSP